MWEEPARADYETIPRGGGMITRSSVIGLGKLGACMAAAMASKNMQVIGVDLNPTTVEIVNRGVAPVTEPGLSECIATHRKRLRATTDFRQAVRESDVSFVIVPTPSDESGCFSLRYLKDAVRELAGALAEKNDYHLVVITSTVLPGSMQYGILPVLERVSGKRCGRDFGLCYNPEFIALGSVIRDLLNPDFVLIGESDTKAGSDLSAFYSAFCDNQAPVQRMNFVNAELAKISVNTFVTTKITFANMLASICEELPGADVDTVTRALGMDARIGRRYLTGALGYGGPCFPRDNQALAFVSRKLGRSASLAEATDRMNRDLSVIQAEKINKAIGPGKTISVLGLAYKPDTNVVEESQAVALAQTLVGTGHAVVVFDPLAMENARQIMRDTVRYARSVRDCLDQSDAVIIANPCREFRDLQPSDFSRHNTPVVVFDCWRILERLKDCSWIDYRPLGVGGADSVAGRRLADLWQLEASTQDPGCR
jgi:UDPglucose 6-dehydrogenase